MSCATIGEALMRIADAATLADIVGALPSSDIVAPVITKKEKRKTFEKASFPISEQLHRLTAEKTEKTASSTSEQLHYPLRIQTQVVAKPGTALSHLCTSASQY